MSKVVLGAFLCMCCDLPCPRAGAAWVQVQQVLMQLMVKLEKDKEELGIQATDGDHDKV